MTAKHDEPGVDGLRHAVEGIELQGPGPDLARIRRGGTRRQRRRRAGAVVAGAAVVFAGVALTAGAVRGTPARTPDFAAAPRNSAEPSDPVTGARAVSALMDGVLSRAGVESPPDEAVPVRSGDTGGPTLGWQKRWSVTDAVPQVSVLLGVYPDGFPDDTVYPCRRGTAVETRGCTDETLPDGTRLLTGESRPAASTDGAGWTPAALAVRPDGRAVVMTVSGLVLDGRSGPDGDYRGPITPDQLQQVVTDPELDLVTNAPGDG